MKKTYLMLCFFIIFCSSSTYSQSEIGGFLGVKLGQSYNEVKTIIQNSYSINSITGTAYASPSIEYNGSSIKLLFCKVESPPITQFFQLAENSIFWGTDKWYGNFATKKA